MHPGTVHIAPPIHNHRPIDYSQSISVLSRAYSRYDPISRYASNSDSISITIYLSILLEATISWPRYSVLRFGELQLDLAVPIS